MNVLIIGKNSYIGSNVKGWLENKGHSVVEFDVLPNQFVLKCNHDSRSVKVIKDEASSTTDDCKELNKFFKGRLRINP